MFFFNIWSATQEAFCPAEKIQGNTVPILTDVLNQFQPSVFNFKPLTPEVIDQYASGFTNREDLSKKEGKSGCFYDLDKTGGQTFFIARCIYGDVEPLSLFFQEDQQYLEQCDRAFIPLMTQYGDNQHFMLIYLTKNYAEPFVSVQEDGESVEEDPIYTWSVCILDPKTSTHAIFYKPSPHIKNCAHVRLGHQKILDYTESGYLALWYLSVLIDYPRQWETVLKNLSYADFIHFALEVLHQSVVKEALVSSFQSGEMITSVQDKINIGTIPIQEDQKSRQSHKRSKKEQIAFYGGTYALAKIFAPNNYLACWVSSWAVTKLKELFENWVPRVGLYQLLAQPICVQTFNTKILAFCQTQAFNKFDDGAGFYKLLDTCANPLKRLITTCCHLSDLPTILQSVKNHIGDEQSMDYQIFIPVIASLLTAIHKKEYQHMFYFNLFQAQEKWQTFLVEPGNIDLITDNMVRNHFSGQNDRLYKYFGFDTHQKIFLNLLPINNYTDSGLYVWQDILLCCKYPRHSHNQ